MANDIDKTLKALEEFRKSLEELKAADERRAREIGEAREADERHAQEAREADERHAREAREADERHAQEAREADERHAQEAREGTERLKRIYGEGWGRVGDMIGGTVESLAAPYVAGYLRTHERIELTDWPMGHYLEIGGVDYEVDLYGRGRRNGQEVTIIGEVKRVVTRNDVEGFHVITEPVLKAFGSSLLRVMFGVEAHPAARDAAKRRKILLLVHRPRRKKKKSPNGRA